MSILTQIKPPVNEDEIPFYNGNVISAATTEPIDNYIGNMLKAQRPTPLQEVAEHVFNEVYEATADLFAAWEAMDRVMTDGNGHDKLDAAQAVIEIEEPMAWVLPEPIDEEVSW